MSAETEGPSDNEFSSEEIFYPDVRVYYTESLTGDKPDQEEANIELTLWKKYGSRVITKSVTRNGVVESEDPQVIHEAVIAAETAFSDFDGGASNIVIDYRDFYRRMQQGEQIGGLAAFITNNGRAIWRMSAFLEQAERADKMNTILQGRSFLLSQMAEKTIAYTEVHRHARWTE